MCNCFVFCVECGYPGSYHDFPGSHSFVTAPEHSIREHELTGDLIDLMNEDHLDSLESCAPPTV